MFQHGFFEARNVYEPTLVLFLVGICVVVDVFFAMDAVGGGAVHPEPVHAVQRKKRYGLIDTSTFQTRGHVGVHCGERGRSHIACLYSIYSHDMSRIY